MCRFLCVSFASCCYGFHPPSPLPFPLVQTWMPTMWCFRSREALLSLWRHGSWCRTKRWCVLNPVLVKAAGERAYPLSAPCFFLRPTHRASVPTVAFLCTVMTNGAFWCHQIRFWVQPFVCTRPQLHGRQHSTRVLLRCRHRTLHPARGSQCPITDGEVASGMPTARKCGGLHVAQL